MVGVLLDVEIQSFLLFDSQFSFFLFGLEVIVFEGLLIASALALIASVVQTGTAHAVEAELVLALGTLHVETAAILENRSFTLGAVLAEK